MIPARFVLTLLGYFGFIIVYALRVNISVAMVAMVGKPQLLNITNIPPQTCQELLVIKNHSTENKDMVMGEFDWDSNMQGQVLGSFFYGYVITQVPGGILAEKYGAKWFYGLGILISSVLTLLTPLAARWNVWSLVALRAVEGLVSGAVFPSMNVLVGRWVPPLERSRLITIMSLGVESGIIITNSLTGYLCESSFLGGWPSVFYICGTAGCVWFLFWMFLIYETPEEHPRISKKELFYIQGEIKPSNKDMAIPWKSIWTSMPVWAIIVAHFGQNWAFYTMLTMMPTYLSNILHLELEDNGIVSALPNLMLVIFALPGSFAADAIRYRGWLHITTIRKLCTSIAMYGACICTLGIAFAGCRTSLIIALFFLSFGINGLHTSGFYVNHVDMSPRFAGTLMGITNAFATLPGFIAPAYVGKILQSGQTLRNWGIVFITSAAIHFISCTFYNVFASAELQPWNGTPDVEKKPKSPSDA